jgi:hypothetical protein
MFNIEIVDQLPPSNFSRKRLTSSFIINCGEKSIIVFLLFLLSFVLNKIYLSVYNKPSIFEKKVR